MMRLLNLFLGLDGSCRYGSTALIYTIANNKKYFSDIIMIKEKFNSMYREMFYFSKFLELNL